ncbi:hypothetical protein SAMN02745115_01466 [[Eubacterium] yurii]|nr:hypothetical protein SAMN02745115_01466 [[Eubacterium] yurii]
MNTKNMKIRFLIIFVGSIIGKLTSFINIHPLFIISLAFIFAFTDAIMYLHFNHIYKKYKAFIEYPILVLVGFSFRHLF